MYPLRFEPVYQTYVWGGQRIASHFHRKSDLPKIAESWEISDRKEGMSVVANGSLKGKTLHQLVLEMQEDLLGTGRHFDCFPILTKIIDANENLSIQVHPDQAMARILKGEPKPEMWVMLDDGIVLAGMKEGIGKKEFEKAIQEHRAEECLQKWELKKGEAIDIPGGRIHAICAGSFIYEVQQNSDTTYRLYDWGRSRPLHLKEGFSAICWEDRSVAKLALRHLSSDAHHQLVRLDATPFFIVERIDIFNQYRLGQIPKSFQIFFCLEGDAQIEVDECCEPFQAGMTYLVPAAAKIINFSGRCQALRIHLS